MDYQFTVVEAPTYVHVIGAGALTAENMRRFLIDAHRSAVERHCDSLLLEPNFSGPSLNFGSIYSIICERSPDGSRYKRIAYVETDQERHQEQAEFAEMAANKLGVNVRLFRSRIEAERWLQNCSVTTRSSVAPPS